MAYVSEVQDTRLAVQDSRIEFGVYCDWCGGHGFEADYCGGVVSVVSFQNVIGVQFHPEKSSKVGSLMISNFITMTNA